MWNNANYITHESSLLTTSIRGFAHCKPSQTGPSGSRSALETNIHQVYIACILNTRLGKRDETKLSELIGRCLFLWLIQQLISNIKKMQSKFSQLPAIFSITGNQTKNWSRIFSEDYFMSNKLYSTTLLLKTHSFYWWFRKCHRKML